MNPTPLKNIEKIKQDQAKPDNLCVNNARADAATDSSDKWQGHVLKGQRARQKEATSQIMPFEN